MQKAFARLKGIARSQLLRPTHALWGQLIRYSFAGGVAAVVNMGLYAISWRLLHPVWPGHDYQVANVIGFLAGNILNYLLCTHFAFDYHRLRKPKQEFGAYFLIGLAGLVWSALILWLLVGLLRLHRDLAKIITIGIVFGWNFGARKLLLFTLPSDRRTLKPCRTHLQPEPQD
jgi:putative flippase GtrA